MIDDSYCTERLATTGGADSVRWLRVKGQQVNSGRDGTAGSAGREVVPVTIAAPAAPANHPIGWFLKVSPEAVDTTCAEARPGPGAAPRVPQLHVLEDC